MRRGIQSLIFSLCFLLISPATYSVTSTGVNPSRDSTLINPKTSPVSAGEKINLGDCIETDQLGLFDTATLAAIKVSVAIPCDPSGSCFQVSNTSWATCPAGYVVVATALSATVSKVAFIPTPPLGNVKAVQDFQIKMRQRCCKLY